MKKTIVALLTIFLIQQQVSAQQNNRWIDGMYIQWGYNVEWYTRSNIHFNMSNGDAFTLHHAKAKDKPDFATIFKRPLQVSIPQYNYRLGFYLNKHHTKSIELNFDHIKYVVTDGQTVGVSGVIDGKQVNGDSILNPATFLHFEHTDGGNLLHLNYVQHRTLAKTKNHSRPLLTGLWKAGAGINIPRTDFTWRGERLNNNFHVSGYNVSIEGGLRLYPCKKFFIELTGKTGYVKYVNALAETPTSKGNRAKHSFAYFENIATFGFDINW